MCYNLISNTLEAIQYAQERGDYHLVEELQRKLMDLEMFREKKYFVSGFSHPTLLTFTNQAPMTPQEFSWGLVPSWIKDWEAAKVQRRKTLNAKSETMFDLNSFKDSAKNRRCLVYVDGFFEYHTQGKKKYPYKIVLADNRPMILAGLWNEWENRTTGEVHKSVTIVTTEANTMMAKIHNEPAASETPRMPVILTKEKQDEWLIDVKTDLDKKHIIELASPLPDGMLHAYTVPQLIGKQGVGNCEAAEQQYVYDDLLLKI